MMKRCGTHSLMMLNLREQRNRVPRRSVARSIGGRRGSPNLPEHTSKLEETYEEEGGQVSHRRQQQLRVVQ